MKQKTSHEREYLLRKNGSFFDVLEGVSFEKKWCDDDGGGDEERERERMMC